MIEPRLLFLGLFAISVYTQNCTVQLCSLEIACPECPIVPSLGCPQYTSTLSPGARSVNECVCIPGTFGPTGSVQCAPCPRGTFTNTYGSVQCAPCPQGTFTNTSGSTMCTVSIPSLPPETTPPKTMSKAIPVNTYVQVTLVFAAPLSVSQVDAIKLKLATKLNISPDLIIVKQSLQSRRLLQTGNYNVDITFPVSQSSISNSSYSNSSYSNSSYSNSSNTSSTPDPLPLFSGLSDLPLGEFVAELQNVINEEMPQWLSEIEIELPPVMGIAVNVVPVYVTPTPTTTAILPTTPAPTPTTPAPTAPPPESQSSSTPVAMIAGIAGAAAVLTGAGIWAAVHFGSGPRHPISAQYDVLAGVSIQYQSSHFPTHKEC